MQTWDEPAIITHGASLRHFDWSRRRLLREFGSFNLSQRDLSFNGAGSWFLAHRAAAPIKAGGRKFERYAGFNVTLREVISVDQPGNLFLPGAGLTVPAHNHIWPRLIPRKSQLPPPLRRVLQGLGRWRHASMGSARQRQSTDRAGATGGTPAHSTRGASTHTRQDGIGLDRQPRTSPGLLLQYKVFL